MIITWSEKPANNSVHGLVALLQRQDWAASSQAPELRNAAARLVNDPDDTIRLLAMPALPALFTDPDQLRDELEQRLLSEPSPMVRAVLLDVMWQGLAGHPDYIDGMLTRLPSHPSWASLSPSPEPITPMENDDTVDADSGFPQAGSRFRNNDMADDGLIQRLVWLSLICDQPFATRLLETWLSAPDEHPARASRTCTWLRPYLTPESGQATEAQADRAFELLAMPIARAASIWEAATRVRQVNDDQATKLKSVVQVSVSIGRVLRLASGAPVTSTSSGTPATHSFAAHAFPVLESLAQVSYPAVVHATVETLDHLSHIDPRRAFLAVEAAATTGHGYEWEPQGADLIVKIIDRYAADYRSLLLSDPECLSALRRLLEAFIRSGWDQAIDRVQNLSEFMY
jgi:hypothetical protein